MRIRLALQVINQDQPAVIVIIHHRLILEVGIVIFGIQLQSFVKQWDIEGRAHAIVPSLLLLQALSGNLELPAARQQIVVLRHGEHRAIALAGRQPDADGIHWRILHVETRGEEAAIDRAMVETRTSHRRELRA